MGRVLHHNVELLAIDEGFLVRQHVDMLHAGKEASLVGCVVALTLPHTPHIKYLDRVNLTIRFPLHFVPARCNKHSRKWES